MQTEPRTAPWWAPWLVIAASLTMFAGASMWASWLDLQETQARQQIRETQVESCERVNMLRGEVNAHVEILDEFLAAAADARVEADDIEAALRYDELRSHLMPIPLTPCEDAFPPQATNGVNDE